MIANVVPITRLRRDTTWWSYLIPNHCKVQVGSLVAVPFRGGKILGIVWGIEETENKASKSIEEVITSTPLVRAPQRHLIQKMSSLGVCSLSTALFQWLPIGLRTLPLSAPSRVLLKNYDGWQLTRTSSTLPAQQAIVVPNKRPDASQILEKRYGQGYSTLWYDQDSKQELIIWFACAQGQLKAGLGREKVIFAPWLNLQQLTLIEPEDISYYHEQIPYCSLLVLAQELCTAYKATLTYRTYLPTESGMLLWHNNLKGNKSKPLSLTITDLKREPIINNDLLKEITETLSRAQKVVILYNAHDRLSKQPEPLSNQRKLFPGIESISKHLCQSLGVPILPTSIVLGTRSILSTPPTNVGLTVVLSLDPLLSSTLFADTLSGIADLGKLFSYAAPCRIQTHSLDHPLVVALANNQLTNYLSQLILTRKNAHLPPFGQQFVCSIPESGNQEKAEQIYLKISNLLQDSWQVSHPFAGTIRRKQYLHLMVYTNRPQALLPGKISSLLSQLPRPWKIQNNPWYIL